LGYKKSFMSPYGSITLYLAVCKHWQAVGWAQAQRHAPYANLEFTDEEVVTIYRFAVALEQKRQI
jgi:hypothetical protein